MTDPIRTCEDHGAFAGEACPACGVDGALLLSSERRRRLSKFVSGALRHFPDDVGLELDRRGWTAYEALVSAVERKYGWARPDHVAAVIATDPKGRFERSGIDGATAGITGGTNGGDEPGDAADGGRVRAAYGHSVDVDLEPTDGPVPDELYHGTAARNLDSILDEGLRPMARQQVHLSGSREAARRVGERHAADPTVLVVDAAGMLADGFRIAQRGRETYATDRVPSDYLAVDDPSS